MVGEGKKGIIVVVENIKYHVTNFSFALVKVFLKKN